MPLVSQLEHTGPPEHCGSLHKPESQREKIELVEGYLYFPSMALVT